MTVSIELIRKENQQVLDFIKDWQNKNEYNPRFLHEYNSKFNAEFADFLNNSGFTAETISTYTI